MVLLKGALWLLSTATRGTTMTDEQRTNCVSENTYQKHAHKNSENEESRTQGLKSICGWSKAFVRQSVRKSRQVQIEEQERKS
jgi:hypothetical protein